MIEHLRRDITPLPLRLSVGEALAFMREHPPGERIVYFYVVDEAGRLRGVVPTTRLLMSQPEARLDDVMATDINRTRDSATTIPST